MRPPAAPVRSQNHVPVQAHTEPNTRHVGPASVTGAEGSTAAQARVSDTGCNTVGTSETSGASTSPVRSQSTGCQAGPETPARNPPVFRTTACQTTGGLLDG